MNLKYKVPDWIIQHEDSKNSSIKEDLIKQLENSHSFFDAKIQATRSRKSKILELGSKRIKLTKQKEQDDLLDEYQSDKENQYHDIIEPDQFKETKIIYTSRTVTEFYVGH